MGGDLFISALYPQSSVESFPDPNKQLNMLPTENHDDAITAADQLVIDSVFRCVADTKASAHNISFASAPVFGINWNRKVIVRITIGNRSGTDALNQILCKMRNSPLPRSDYERAGDLLKKAFVAPAFYLHDWEEWRVITERYRMGRRREWAALDAVVARLASAGLNSPLDLAVLGAAGIEHRILNYDSRAAARDLWRTARLSAATASSADHLILAPSATTAATFKRATNRRRTELEQHDPPVSRDGSCSNFHRIFPEWARLLGFAASASPNRRQCGSGGISRIELRRTC